ncbi:hypothetical protein QQS21_008790 [Conoideocrella luteorostrata]|uniref:C2H2-type domain-containing protein n=1 Tax=Conoideocrella luteorostrata TaxID=1105319 RepID=A0AAJ0CKX1_9HYPO|nr:hypothetical protein QQS21_008790 [Conoideocrella luteorostrata]
MKERKKEEEKKKQLKGKRDKTAEQAKEMRRSFASPIPADTGLALVVSAVHISRAGFRRYCIQALLRSESAMMDYDIHGMAAVEYHVLHRLDDSSSKDGPQTVRDNDGLGFSGGRNVSDLSFITTEDCKIYEDSENSNYSDLSDVSLSSIAGRSDFCPSDGSDLSEFYPSNDSDLSDFYSCDDSDLSDFYTSDDDSDLSDEEEPANLSLSHGEAGTGRRSRRAGPFFCDVVECQQSIDRYAFRHRSDYYIHKKNHRGPFFCNILDCDQAIRKSPFTCYQIYKRHLKNHQGPFFCSIPECQLCIQRHPFKTYPPYKRHLKNHEGPFFCSIPECHLYIQKYPFRTYHCYRYHMKDHKGPFFCTTPDCHKYVHAIPIMIYRHYILHCRGHQEGEFFCHYPSCKKDIGQRAYHGARRLRQHIASKHVAAECDIEDCDWIGERKQLRVHQRAYHRIVFPSRREELPLPPTRKAQRVDER